MQKQGKRIMADRITVKHLRARVATLNSIFGYAGDAYQDARGPDGGLIANAGTYTLDGAYGGWRLCQMCAGGGERDITGRGTYRETYDAINAFIDGAQAMRRHIQAMESA
jgi:hypothetical protein